MFYFIIINPKTQPATIHLGVNCLYKIITVIFGFFATLSPRFAKSFAMVRNGLRKSEVGSRKSEVRSQKSEVRSRKSLLGFRTMRDTGRDLCVSVIIWASRRALRNGEIIRICMGKKRLLLQFKNANKFSIKISLPELPCLLSFLFSGFWSDWARFQSVLVPLIFSLYIPIYREKINGNKTHCWHGNQKLHLYF